MTDFIEVEKDSINMLAKLAYDIWHEYWGIILSNAQIEYMVDKFQSEHAIIHQYNYENYTYYFIKEDEQNVGYFGISGRKDYLFLSKLYIIKNFRSRGIGRKAFEKIKELALLEDYKEIRLTVNKHNKNTIEAYKKWGFRTIDAVETDIGSGFIMDDYIMSCKI